MMKEGSQTRACVLIMCIYIQWGMSDIMLTVGVRLWGRERETSVRCGRSWQSGQDLRWLPDHITNNTSSLASPGQHMDTMLALTGNIVALSPHHLIGVLVLFVVGSVCTTELQSDVTRLGCSAYWAWCTLQWMDLTTQAHTVFITRAVVRIQLQSYSILPTAVS